LRIAVLMGGPSAEREVSLQSGERVQKALTERGHDVVALDWRGPEQNLWQALRHEGITVAFLALHGTYGEDGCVQGLLEILGIPYTGSSVMASALAMDKLKSKELFRLHNVPTPPYYVFEGKCASDIEELHGSFGFPAIVKPRREGSSIGVTRADNMSELAQAIETALAYDDSVLIERFVKGSEVAVGVLDGRVLGAIEVAPRAGLYDFRAKYTPGMTDYYMPARLPPARYRGVLNLAERACQALDTSGAVRVDLIVTEGQNEYVLEVNTLPGMTQTSLLPKIAAAAGFGFTELCEAMLSRAELHTGSPRPRANSVVSELESPEEVLVPSRRKRSAQLRSA
jgi:D-alanine-D-alanine ligase